MQLQSSKEIPDNLLLSIVEIELIEILQWPGQTTASIFIQRVKHYTHLQ